MPSIAEKTPRRQGDDAQWRVPPAPLSGVVTLALRELARRTGSRALAELSGQQLLMERAWLMNATFASGRSLGGSCRFLPCADGIIALTMARDSDWELVPAWLERDDHAAWVPAAGNRWARLATAVCDQPVDTLVERARLLGLAIATPGGLPRVASARPYDVVHENVAEQPPSSPAAAAPRVLDMSALWAGPLCSHLLRLGGADVIKVESPHRPDGARFGHPGFYRLLNQGKRSVALDLRQAGGRDALRRLISTADIVIESARPRALEQMGIHAEEALRSHPRLTWLSITGHGREPPAGNWIGFGDDAGVAAGLSDVMQAAVGRHQFAGDAIADPLTGVHAALAAWRSWQAGGSRLLALSLSGVARWCLAQELERTGAAATGGSFAAWWQLVISGNAQAGRQDRAIREGVATLGRHTELVLQEISC